MPYDHDLITIGAGSGGVALSRRAALHGANVAVVEGSRVGGTCVIRGCVPKKLLMYAAQYGDALLEAPHYGWSLPTAPAHFEMAAWQHKKAAETLRLETVYRNMLANGGVHLVDGRARLVAPHTVEVDGRRLTARHIVLATGASPVRDSIEGIADCAVSDDLLDLDHLPGAAAVIGGGYIAVEFASMLVRLGVKVTMFYRDHLPLRHFDHDLRSRLATHLADAGIHLRPAEAPLKISRHHEGWRLELPGGATFETPWVLNATGRRANTAGLGLDTMGVQLDRRGSVQVDAKFASSAPGIHAIGDVSNGRHLTPVAIVEGRWLADHLFSTPSPPLDLNTIATAVFTVPPLATVGLSEAQAVRRGLPVQVFEADFRPMRQVFTGRSERIYMKLLADAATDRVLGLHMIGADAPEIVQSLAVALSAGATKAQFDRTVAVHPTAAEEWVLMREPARTVAAPPA